jgi:hypothetical protein
MDGVKVLVGWGVNDGVKVIDGVKVGVIVNVFVAAGRKFVAVNVGVSVGVEVEVAVGVGVFVTVSVKIMGVPLTVGRERVPVAVRAGVYV